MTVLADGEGRSQSDEAVPDHPDSPPTSTSNRICHVDPYAIWAIESGFRSFMSEGRWPLMLDFLVQLNDSYDPAQHTWAGMPGSAHATVPEIYGEALDTTRQRAKHITLRLCMQDANDVAQAIRAVTVHPHVARAQMGVPGTPLPDAEGDQLPAAIPPKIPAPLPEPAHAWSPSQSKVVLGALEDACPFAHQALRNVGGLTRVVALWDQTSTRSSAQDPVPVGFGYGRERTRDEFDGLMHRYTRDGRVDEERLYADPACLQRRLRSSFGSHASAVLTLLAGDRRHLPSVPQQTRALAVDEIRDLQQQPDAATRAPLIVVQLPREQIDLVGSRWLTVRALDGMRYIIDRAKALGAPLSERLPLVINMSYGSVAGAHDGTGLLECAIAELIEGHGDMAVVLAAGNAAGGGLRAEGGSACTHKPKGLHAQKNELAVEQTAQLHLVVPPEMTRDTYVEVWFSPASVPDSRTGGSSFLEDGEVELELISPLGEKIKTSMTSAYSDGQWPVNGSSPHGLLAFSRVAQSARRSMALVVVGPTTVGKGQNAASAGEWCLRVTNHGNRVLDVEAWVERDWVPGTAQASQRARFRSAPNDLCAFKLTDLNTLNNIATGPKVVRAGACMALVADGEKDPSPSSYCSLPAEGAVPIEFFAIADVSPASPGIRVSGNLSGSVNRMNGTSVAAPQVARWLANQVAQGQKQLSACIPKATEHGYGADFGRMISNEPEDPGRTGA